jgi:hypothetical protein
LKLCHQRFGLDTLKRVVEDVPDGVILLGGFLVGGLSAVQILQHVVYVEIRVDFGSVAASHLNDSLLDFSPCLVDLLVHAPSEDCLLRGGHGLGGLCYAR